MCFKVINHFVDASSLSSKHGQYFMRAHLIKMGTSRIIEFRWQSAHWSPLVWCKNNVVVLRENRFHLPWEYSKKEATSAHPDGKSQILSESDYPVQLMNSGFPKNSRWYMASPHAHRLSADCIAYTAWRMHRNHI